MVPRAAALAVTAVAIGFAAAQFATWRAPPIETFPRKAVVLTGVVRGVEILPEGRRVTVADAQFGDGPALVRTLHIRLRDTDPAVLSAGDVVRLRSVLRPPAPPGLSGCLGSAAGMRISPASAAPAWRLAGWAVVAQASPSGPARWLQGCAMLSRRGSWPRCPAPRGRSPQRC